MAETSQDRWQRAWSHREQLLKVARRRSMSVEDAEDAVHEAMLRAAENPHLDDERLGAWLTTVTMRLCVDRYRQVHREAEVHNSPTLITPGPAPVEDVVCDRAEAKWLAVRSGELPARQAEALWLKSEDLDVGQVAVKMGLSYRTVESLLARARRTLRNSLAATLGLAVWLCDRCRPRTVGNAQAVAVASTAAATLVVAGFVLPYDHGGDGPPVRSPATSDTAKVRVADGDGARRPPAPASAASPVTSSLVPSPTSSPSPLLPVVSVPPLPSLPSPDVPEVTEMVRGASLPPLPLPGVDAPAVPPVPAEPGAAAAPMPSAPPALSVPALPTTVPPVPMDAPTP
ncbi:sigma-70 family RNA polymerase sigma factor [Streptomyces sp. NPDC002133]|uniref:RNA polymerase sigma factor n=1 Tax=Streptomyces sp. NPDC002133 TaxID=3154409 RepID=UPI003331E53C